MQGVQYSAELLTALPGLTGLTGLWLDHRRYTGEGLEALCQLTGLQKLNVSFPKSTQEGLLLQLTQLTQLIALYYQGPVDGACKKIHTVHKVRGHFILPFLLLACLSA